jgi:hypothetical protein
MNRVGMALVGAAMVLYLVISLIAIGVPVELA